MDVWVNAEIFVIRSPPIGRRPGVCGGVCVVFFSVTFGAPPGFGSDARDEKDVFRPPHTTRRPGVCGAKGLVSPLINLAAPPGFSFGRWR